MWGGPTLQRRGVSRCCPHCVAVESLWHSLFCLGSRARYGIVCNAAVKNVLQALVRRLADTNQNLRPKAADCIAVIATGVGAEVEKVRRVAKVSTRMLATQLVPPACFICLVGP